MRIRCLSFAMLTALVAVPASAAGVIKCKIEGQRIVFQIDDHGANADVAIGTLTSTPSLVFKNVPIATQADQSIVVQATPAQQVASTDKLKCADLKRSFHLELKPGQGAGVYSGELTMQPYYGKGSDRKSGCKGFSAPDTPDESFVNVICKKQ